MRVSKQPEKIRAVVTCDYHIPFLDQNVFNTMLSFTKKYKPNLFVINGDFMDMYSLSDFEKNPERVNNLQQEIDLAKKVLKQIKRTVGKKCRVVLLEGNHENRLQKFIWRNKELKDLNILTLPSLLGLGELGIDFIPANRDYWRTQNGHFSLNNLIITHGDSRLNGTATSKYSGYSAKNSMYNLNTNIIIGHCHRLAQVYATTPDRTLIGIEGGSLCVKTGTANWQQGFVSFEQSTTDFKPTLHFINQKSPKLYK